MYACYRCQTVVYAKDLNEILHNNKLCPLCFGLNQQGIRGKTKMIKVPRKKHVMYICQDCGKNHKDITLQCEKCESVNIVREMWYE